MQKSLYWIPQPLERKQSSEREVLEKALYFDERDVVEACSRPGEPAHWVRSSDGRSSGLVFGGEIVEALPKNIEGYPWEGKVPAVLPETLGDCSFLTAHGVRFPYIAGAMAHGIASVNLVKAMAEAGMLSFFGTGGLPLTRIETEIVDLAAGLDAQNLPWGANLIHAPDNLALEEATVDLFLRHGVRRVSASAFMRLTPSIVRFACQGLRQRSDGTIDRRHHVFAKVSRPRIAKLFLSPAPERILRTLVEQGHLDPQEAELASRIPVAEDVTVEADSGGHTDNRPLTAILPVILQTRDELSRQWGYQRSVRVGAAGGLGTPGALAAAFAMGADYVLTGSINQGTVESGLAAEGKALLAKMDIADVIMAPSPDMFEQGVQVQVLKRGTLFAARAKKLYEIYRKYDRLEDLLPEEVQKLENEIFRAPITEIWQQTRDYLSWRNPRELERAERDPKHRMARIFRWYVGKSSHWAVEGEESRKSDYQIWCGPAMGAFNAWTRGTFLAEPEARTVVTVARQLLHATTAMVRAQQLRALGFAVPTSCFDQRPIPF